MHRIEAYTRQAIIFIIIITILFTDSTDFKKEKKKYNKTMMI